MAVPRFWSQVVATSVAFATCADWCRQELRMSRLLLPLCFSLLISLVPTLS